MRLKTLTLAVPLVALVACEAQEAPKKDPPKPEKTEKEPKKEPEKKEESTSTRSEFLAGTAKHSKYTEDVAPVPRRVGIERHFLGLDKVNTLRDPMVHPDGDSVLAFARVGTNQGLFRIWIDKKQPAKLVLPLPRVERKHKLSIHNRNNWYIGTAKQLGDKHFIFGASTLNAGASWPAVIGISPINGGKVAAVQMKDLKVARFPAPHPTAEGEFIFSACDEVRQAKLKNKGDQVLLSRPLLKLEKVNEKMDNLCTIFRPRISPDGRTIAFEVVGRHLSEAEQKKYNVPKPKNPGDAVLEIWVANADGSGVKRFMSDAAYQMLGGRNQPGGSREPEFSPDSKRLAFAHGGRIVVASADGLSARVVASSNLNGTPIQFYGEDPVWIDDNTIAFASRISGKTGVPPGIGVIRLDQIPEGTNPREPVK